MISCARPGSVQARTSDARLSNTAGRKIMRIARSPWERRSGHRDFADVLRHLVALLNRWPLGDGRVPALHVGILIEIDGLPFEARHPRPGGDIGDRIIVGDEFAVGEPLVEYAIEPLRLFEITLLGVWGLALVVFHE